MLHYTVLYCLVLYRTVSRTLKVLMSYVEVVYSMTAKHDSVSVVLTPAIACSSGSRTLKVKRLGQGGTMV